MSVRRFCTALHWRRFSQKHNVFFLDLPSSSPAYSCDGKIQVHCFLLWVICISSWCLCHCLFWMFGGPRDGSRDWGSSTMIGVLTQDLLLHFYGSLYFNFRLHFPYIFSVLFVGFSISGKHFFFRMDCGFPPSNLFLL